MTSRSTKQKRDAKYLEQGRYMRQVGQIVQKLAPELIALDPPIVRTKYLGPFGGAPDNFDVSFVFSTRATAKTSEKSGVLERAAHLVLEALRGDNYPSEALPTFRFNAISEEQIKDAGGEWDFDRNGGN